MKLSKGFKLILASSLFSAGALTGFYFAQEKYHPIIDQYQQSLDFVVTSCIKTSTTYKHKLMECNQKLEYMVDYHNDINNNSQQQQQ
jgi:hypothetical protein